jgi:asparagine synthase (glutamine-hydrolysing)
MCGIFGQYSPEGIKNPGIFNDISNILKHRGPDDEGYIAELKDNSFIELSGNDTINELKSLKHINSMTVSDKIIYIAGHRRLSIIDLSANGHQPVSNQRYIFSFNGEIYNYLELRDELINSGYQYKSKCDTEIAFVSFIHWGTECFSKFRGMWAISIYDRYEKKLYLCRDRYGIKPLYYYTNDETISYSSEIKGLLPLIDNSMPNIQAIFDMIFYFQLDFNETCFFKDIFQVEPGFIYIFENGKINRQKYYELKTDNNPIDEKSLVNIKNSLLDSISIHLRSDVECGACLSGGIDSSVIAGISAKEYGYRLKTFSAVFPGENIDESSLIRRSTEFLKLDSFTTTPDENDLTNEIYKTIYHQDEPFPTTSIFAQWDVFKIINRRNIKVILDGQGADEIFGGYYSYFKYFFSQVFSEKGFPDLISGLFKSYFVSSNIPKYYIYSLLSPSIKKNIRINEKLKWADKEFISNGYNNSSYNENEYLNVNEGLKKHITSTLRALLRYEDRNSMAFSVESRVPYLDHKLIDLLFSIDGMDKFSYDTNKIILRSIAKDYVPEAVLNNKRKIGFTSPENKWINSSVFENKFGDKYKEPVFLKKNGIISGSYNYKSLNENQKWIITCLEIWSEIYKL